MITKAQIEALLELLKQPSTYKGIIGLLSLLGIVVMPTDWEVFVTGLMAIYFAIAIFWQKS